MAISPRRPNASQKLGHTAIVNRKPISGSFIWSRWLGFAFRRTHSVLLQVSGIRALSRTLSSEPVARKPILTIVSSIRP